uniref:Ubiquitously expressed prefoldin like chaperone n=1 Tax=Vombatus ursinus TaxID=29139 RepID=A0A4X2KXR7_VOMUR
MAEGSRGAQEKVLQYETFVSDVLQRDLRQVLAQREEVYRKLAGYLQLKNILERIQVRRAGSGARGPQPLGRRAGRPAKHTPPPPQASGGQNLRTQVDLGCNFYVNAEVPDPSRIFVTLGYGFFLELTLKEALKFIDRKSHFLILLSDRLTRDSVRIKAHIRLVLEGLRELQGFLEPEDSGH